MKIFKDSIIALASEGRLTLQIPEYSVDIVNNRIVPITDDDEFEIIPDDWVCKLRSNHLPVVGKQDGFLYLTKKGYEANKDKLKIAFENSNMRYGGAGKWHLFEEHAQEHFDKVAKAQKRLLNELQNKLAQIQNFQV